MTQQNEQYNQQNDSKSHTKPNKFVKIFFYIAPLIGIILAVFYLKQSEEKLIESSISPNNNIESVVMEVIQKVDTEKCIDLKSKGQIIQKEIENAMKKRNMK